MLVDTPDKVARDANIERPADAARKDIDLVDAFPHSPTLGVAGSPGKSLILCHSRESGNPVIPVIQANSGRWLLDRPVKPGDDKYGLAESSPRYPRFPNLPYTAPTSSF